MSAKDQLHQAHIMPLDEELSLFSLRLPLVTKNLSH